MISMKMIVEVYNTIAYIALVSFLKNASLNTKASGIVRPILVNMMDLLAKSPRFRRMMISSEVCEQVRDRVGA